VNTELLTPGIEPHAAVGNVGQLSGAKCAGFLQKKKPPAVSRRGSLLLSGDNQAIRHTVDTSAADPCDPGKPETVQANAQARLPTSISSPPWSALQKADHLRIIENLIRESSFADQSK
jgi:hypothetical protein